MDTYVPVYYEVQAEKFYWSRECAERIVAQCEGKVKIAEEQYAVGSLTDEDIGYILVAETLEGIMRCNNGDYVVRGVNGEYYFCKPDIFEKKHRKLRSCEQRASANHKRKVTQVKEA